MRRHPVTRCVVAYWVLPHPTSSDALNRLCNEMHSFKDFRIFKFSKSTATLFYSITVLRTAPPSAYHTILECNAIFSIFSQIFNFPIFSSFQFFSNCRSVPPNHRPSVRPSPPTPRSQAVPQHSPSSEFSGATLRCAVALWRFTAALCYFKFKPENNVAIDGGFTVYSV